MTGLGAMLLAGVAAVAQASSGGHWIASWGAAQQVPEPNNALPPATLTDATLRQIVHLSIGGPRVRVRFSNAFGPQPMVIDGAHLARAARPGTALLVPGSDRALSFDGGASVTIPAGAELYSDPVDLSLPAGADLAVSIHLARPPAGETGHPGSRSTSFTLAGDHLGDADLPGAGRIEHWYQLSDVEVDAPGSPGLVVAVGDSITDGHGVATDHNARWPDVLARRLAAADIGVINVGIGGNHVLTDGLGPNLLARFDRDVLARSGVRWAVLLEAINDIGGLSRDGPDTPAAHAALVARITGAYRQMAERAHAHGIRLVGATVTPFTGSDYYHPNAASEADRRAVNAFIRGSGVFDAVVDFDRVVRDPAHPERLLPAYDSGDHLHPSEAGYAAMGAAIPLTLFTSRSAGRPVAGVSAPVPMAPAQQPGAPTIALTFDDLPAHGPLPSGVTRVQIVHDIVAALHAQRAPAFGFVAAGLGAGDPATPPVLDAWRAAFPMGNHSYSHANLATLTAEQYEADVARDEPFIASRMKGADWHWFRYPFLSEGDTPAQRDAVRSWLAGQGYRIAAVTMSFGDYSWNEPYARCLARHDAAAIVQLETSYLDAARTEALRERHLSQAALGRDIPYVLLMHVGAFDARMLPRLLDLYRSLGFTFTSLPQAESDPFYAAAVDLRLPGPTPSLAAAAGARGIAVPPAPPMAPELCR